MEKDKRRIKLFFMGCFLYALWLFSAPLRTQEDKTIRSLKRQGYTNIETDGYGWFSCGSRDVFSTKFVAKSPSGEKVSGCLCSGILKGSTVRYD